LKPLEGGLHLPHCTFISAVHHLCIDPILIAHASERQSQLALALAVSINERRIECIHAELDGPVNKVDRFSVRPLPIPLDAPQLYNAHVPTQPAERTFWHRVSEKVLKGRRV